MGSGTSYLCALQIPGGKPSAPTYVGSSNAAGQYSARAATITALSAGGVFGGFAGIRNNGPVVAHTQASYGSGYITLDGLVFTGFAYKAVRIGGISSGDGPANVHGVIVQNCVFTGGAHNAGDSTDNSDSLWLDGTIGAVATNNYFYNNTGFSAGSSDHVDAIILWSTQGTVLEYNTCINAGGFHSKEIANQGAMVQYNYIDVSMYTSQSSANALFDFCGAPTPGLTQTTNIHHNILLSSYFAMSLVNGLTQTEGFTTPVNIYNNTVIMKSMGGYVETAVWIFSSLPRSVAFYNNILTGAASSDYKMVRINADAPRLWDYNLFPASGMSWALVANANGAATQGAYGSLGAMQAAISSLGGISTFDTHSVASNNPGFIGSGTLAAIYQLTSGAAAAGAGRVGGVSSGASVNMGAWDGIVTQIGSSINSTATVLPDPPSNVTVS
jgi:hypothetical protein